MKTTGMSAGFKYWFRFLILMFIIEIFACAQNGVGQVE